MQISEIVQNWFKVNSVHWEGRNCTKQNLYSFEVWKYYGFLLRKDSVLSKQIKPMQCDTIFVSCVEFLPVVVAIISQIFEFHFVGTWES